MLGPFWSGERAKDALILFGCALLNVLLTLLLYPKFAYIGTDGVSYALMAKSLAEGSGLTVFHQPHTFYSPGFSFAIVPFYWLIGNIDLAAHVSMIVLGLLTLPFFYYGMRFFVERYVAAIATLFLAVNATVIWRNMRPIAQPLAAFLSVVLFFLLTKYVELDKQRQKVFAFSFLLGLIAGALYLTRPEYILLIFPLTAFLFSINRKAVTLKRNIAIIFAAVLGFVLCATPYIVYLHAHTGQWTFAGRLQQEMLVVQGLSTTGEGAQLLISPTANNSVTSYLGHIFAPKFLKVYFSNLFDIEWFLLRIFGIIGFSFFGIGLWKTIKEKRWNLLGVLAVPTFMLFALAVGSDGDFGYLEPYVFIFVAFIGIGCYEFISTLAESIPLVSWGHRLVAIGIVAVSAAYFAFPIFQNFFFRPADTTKPVEYQLLGQYFKDTVERPEQQSIASRKPEIAFYAGADWVEITGRETPEQILKIMKEKHTGYLALDTRELGDVVQRFVDAKEKSATQEFTLIKEFEYGMERVNLYLLRD
ncbi:MAG: hypothetical protein A3D65_04835 [Candidatus Lloydbacteria bacterium RIFCSPHIGHO2_02_FULL_50_13]|uniref:Uncharacterized protein n=1 Tax=Candidatus Lloydbacteria bacterium RIFCSPHIGHO2_02_FULL_50_13 TaxID=1798661 RepID=A0A1G2D4P1_9BACT|nr:MAG: hypothetical protein A3D65_04835 [Candidatus Lloydbacteria bacterium RIFCSPHIGHO2_02_FULL_50_13]